MQAEIVAVGTELLMGETADTNSGWLAASLPPLGVELRWITAVGDDLERLREAVGRAWARSDLTLVIGGLGPTEDDLTRSGIAEALGERLFPHPDAVAWLEERFRSRGQPMPRHNLRQAEAIASAEPVRNTVGTAPGWWVERDGRLLLTLPGPPNELMEMWRGALLPRLQRRVAGSVIRTRTFKTIGLSEAAVDEMVQHLYGDEGVDLGCYAKVDGIYLRAIARAADEGTAVGRLDALDAQVRSALGAHLWGVDEETPERRAGELLRERGWTLGVVESCTGGLVAGALTDVPGSSRYFKGGTVAYTEAMKLAVGVSAAVVAQHGVVSRACAVEMAQAAVRYHGTDCGIGVTGVAGPDAVVERGEERPVGLVYIGVALPGRAAASEHRFPARRALVRGRAVAMALLELCRELASGGVAAPLRH